MILLLFQLIFFSAKVIGLIVSLYIGTESLVKCGVGMFSFFPMNLGVRDRLFLQHHFSTFDV